MLKIEAATFVSSRMENDLCHTHDGGLSQEGLRLQYRPPQSLSAQHLDYRKPLKISPEYHHFCE